MGSTMRTLVWFRSDLRRADNVALADACISGDEGVVGLFLTAPLQWRDHGWGAPRVDHVLRSVAVLSERLEAWSVPLLVRRADRFAEAAQAVVAAARETGCGEVIYNRECGEDEMQRDREVEAACREAGLRVTSYNERTVVPPGLVLTQERAKPYTVFTPFYRAWTTWLDAHGWPMPQGDPRRPRLAHGVQSEPVPETLPGFEKPMCAARWPAGELEAGRRLAQFVDKKVSGYDADRSRHDREGTSALSPYLACGSIAPARCVAAIHPLTERITPYREGARAWLEQIVWREFLAHVLVGYPQVGRGEAFRQAGDALPWRDDEDGFERWCRGETGYPVVDAAMRQLAAEGWMHNRLRMIVAMFLCKDLLIDWRRGERFFMEHLVDADFACNNGGWQWVSGTGTDAVAFPRMFNPETQSRRFDPDGAYLRSWLPELDSLNAKDIHAPWTVPDEPRLRLDYPERMVHHASVRRRFLIAVRDARLIS